MKYLKVFLLALVLSLSANIFSQTLPEQQTVKTTTYTIKGSVVDTTAKAVAYPTVSVKKDSTAFDYSDRYSGNGDGTFEFQYTSAAGTLFVNISADTKVSENRAVVLASEPIIDLGRITLHDGEELAGVAVVAYKPLVTQSIDRINYDIEADPDSKTNTVMDMLRKVPMVTVDKDDKIRVKGSTSYKIYINGKPSNMVTKNPKDVLKSMPASSIKKIEVITDPGVKYDAEGVSAILNIITKSALQGYQGSISGNADSKGDWGVGAYFTTKVGKWGVTANYNYYDFVQPVWMNSTLDVKNASSPYKRSISNAENTYDGNYHFGNIEMSYEIDSLNLISGSFGLRGGNYTAKNPVSRRAFISQTGDTISVYNSDGSDSYQHSFDISGNIDYQRSFRKPQQLLTLSYNFSLSPVKNKSLSIVRLDPHYPNTLGTTEKNTQLSSVGTSDEHTFQIDYTEPFADKHIIEAGLKYILRYNASDNSYRRYNSATGGYDLPELDASGNPRSEDDMKYYQHILGAYASYTFKLEKFSFRLGGRFEGTFQDVKFTNSKQKNFDVKFWDIIPSVSVSYNPSFVSNFKLSYNNSISRPSISYLNPYINDSDPYVLEYGNPNLKSERNHNFSLNYGFFSQKFNINLSADASFKNNSIESRAFIDNENRINRTYANIGSHRRLGSSVFVNYNPFMWVGVWVQASANYYRYINDNYDFGGGSIYGFGGLNFNLPWKLRFSLSGGGSSPQVNYKETGVSWYFYYAALSRGFLKNDQLTVSLSVENPFEEYHTYRWRTWEDNVYDNRFEARNYARTFRISVSWRFGEMKAEVKKAERGITNDDLKKGKSGAGGSTGGAPSQTGQ